MLNFLNSLNDQTFVFESSSDKTTFADLAKTLSDEQRQELLPLIKKVFKKYNKNPHTDRLGVELVGIAVHDTAIGAMSYRTFKQFITNLISLDVNNLFTKYTDLPIYDDMINDPTYFSQEKHKDFKHTTMSPSTYLRKCNVGFSKTGETGLFEVDGSVKKLATKYAFQLVKGDKFPLPILHYIMGKNGKLYDFSQEGRHRAVAADLLSVKEIPVLIVTENRGGTKEQYQKFKQRWLT